MFQDIAPHVYHNEMRFRQPEPDDFVLHYCEKDFSICAKRRTGLSCLRSDRWVRIKHS